MTKRRNFPRSLAADNQTCKLEWMGATGTGLPRLMECLRLLHWKRVHFFLAASASCLAAVPGLYRRWLRRVGIVLRVWESLFHTGAYIFSQQDCSFG